jgi:MSHA biogenesis protein MshJ
MSQSLVSNVKLKWRDYSAKYLKITQREQVLMLATGIIAITFILFNFVIEPQIIHLKNVNQKISQTQLAITINTNAITALERRLLEDPNDVLKKQSAYYEQKISKVDKEILALTSDLIDPIQMRHALMALLKLQKGVVLLSFELLGTEPLIPPQRVEEITIKSEKKAKPTQVTQSSSVSTSAEIGLYKHGVKIKLKGNYFPLRDYLQQLEGLQWKFFWNEFHYKIVEYPQSELEIEIFSLSTQEEFLGV